MMKPPFHLISIKLPTHQIIHQIQVTKVMFQGYRVNNYLINRLPQITINYLTT